MPDGADGARGPCPHGRPAGESCDACNEDEIDLREQADVELREEPITQQPTESRHVGTGSKQSIPRDPGRSAGRGPGLGGTPAPAAGLLVLVARQGLCTLDPPGIAHLDPATETTEDAVRQLADQGWRVVRTQVHPRHTVTIFAPAE